MKKLHNTFMISMLALILTMSSAYAGHMMGEDIKLGSLIGAEVTNMQGESLGTIRELVYNNQSETITFAVLSQGRIKGMGESFTPVPMTSLRFRPDNRVILNMSREKLMTAPSFSSNDWPDMTNRKWSSKTYKFYGARPYWKEERMKEKMEEEAVQERYKYKGPTKKYGTPDY